MSLVFVGEVINENDCIHHIIDNIYLGNCNSRNFISNHNISRIIEIGEQEELDKYPEISQNFDKLTVKIPDNRDVKIQSYFQDVWDFIQKDSKNVLIHCKMGTSRSVAFVISYLIKYKSMSFDQSLSYIKDLRGDSLYTKPNIGFTKILRKL
jgi:predicted protein tyrosine phosphatase